MHTTEEPARSPILLRTARQPHAALRRKLGDRGALGQAGAILQRQRLIGNAAVQRLLAAAKAQGDNISGQAAAAEVEDEIGRARGGGRALDHGARAQMEPALGADLAGVRVHTDGRADRLNEALEARAFTTGQDIFFRQGQYDPGSAGGRELLAHELTHVVQQAGGVQAKLTVGAPDDEYEQEADQVAQRVMRREMEPVQRQPEAEKAETGAAESVAEEMDHD